MYATWVNDSILKNGKHVGLATWPAYTANAQAMTSLAVIDLDHAEVGTEVTFLWGEPGSTRASVEAHEVREVRATVAQAPYFEKLIKTGQ
jgi:glycine cleavage system aminomethyltransferase T